MHRFGNNPKCIDCKYYYSEEKNTRCIEPGKECLVNWNYTCRNWIEKERGLTHFEVMTLKPDPRRKPLEIEYITNILKNATEVQNG